MIGHTSPSAGSLAEYGVNYEQVDLLKDAETPDLEGIQAALKANSAIRMVHIQRSRGYCTRPSLSIQWIERIVKATHHRPFDAQSNEHKAFCRTMIEKCELIEQQYRPIKMTEEKEFFNTYL